MDKEIQEIKEKWGDMDVRIQYDENEEEIIKSIEIKNKNETIIIAESMDENSSIIIVRMYGFTDKKGVELCKNKIWNMVNRKKLSFFEVEYDYKNNNECRTENQDLKKTEHFLNTVKEKITAAWFGIEWKYRENRNIVIKNIEKEKIELFFKYNETIYVSVDKLIYLQNNAKKLEEKRVSEKNEIKSKFEEITGDSIDIMSNMNIDENAEPIFTHYIEPPYQLGWTGKRIQITELYEYIGLYIEVTKQTELLQKLLEKQMENVIWFTEKNTFRWNEQPFQYHFQNKNETFQFQIEKWLEDEPLIPPFSFKKGDGISEKLESYIKSIKLLTIMQ